MSTNPELSELLVADGQELDKVILYVNDIAPYSGMVAGFPPNLWPWIATEWLSASSLLLQLQRMPEYHPYVWSESCCKMFAIKEAEAWDKYLANYDYQAFLRKHYEVSTNVNEASPQQHESGSSNATAPLSLQRIIYSGATATLPPAAARTADGRDLFWLELF